jgi:hypothetical protein
MYALIGDSINVLGRVAILISTDDDANTYLVWVPEQQEYLVVPQHFVWQSDRWVEALAAALNRLSKGYEDITEVEF